MNLKEIGINTTQLGSFGSGQSLLEIYCETCIEVLDSIGHGVSLLLLLLLLLLFVLLSMLFISRSLDLRMICISSLCFIDKLSFPSFLVFSFLLQLPVSSPVSQIIKELCSSSSYSFHSCHLSFNGIMKEAISSQNMTNSIDTSSICPRMVS